MQLAVQADPPVYGPSPSYSPSTRRGSKLMVAGVAMASAGAIALSPVSPMPDIQEVSERAAQAAAVELTAATNPFVVWGPDGRQHLRQPVEADCRHHGCRVQSAGSAEHRLHLPGDRELPGAEHPEPPRAAAERVPELQHELRAHHPDRPCEHQHGDGDRVRTAAGRAPEVAGVPVGRQVLRGVLGGQRLVRAELSGRDAATDPDLLHPWSVRGQSPPAR